MASEAQGGSEGKTLPTGCRGAQTLKVPDVLAVDSQMNFIPERTSLQDSITHSDFHEVLELKLLLK